MMTFQLLPCVVVQDRSMLFGLCVAGVESFYKVLGGEEMGLEDARGLGRHAFLSLGSLCGFNHSGCTVSWSG